MKKLMHIILVLCLIFTFASCGRDEGQAWTDIGWQWDSEVAAERSQDEAAVKNSGELALGSYAAAQIEVPAEVDKIRSISVHEDWLFAAGTKDEAVTLYRMDLTIGGWEKLDALKIQGFMSIEGLAASDGTMFLICSRMEDRDVVFELHKYDARSGIYVETCPLEGMVNTVSKHWMALDRKLICSTEFGGIAAFSSQGESLWSINVGADFIANVEGMPIYQASLPGAKEQALFELDLDTGDSRQLCMVEGDYCVSYTSFYGAVLADDVSVYSVNLGSGETAHILDWRDSGAAFGLAPRDLQLLADGSFFAIDRLSGSIYHLTPSATEEGNILTIGCGEGAYGPYLTQAVAEFNMSHQGYTARMEVYTAEDVDRILAQISAGKGPDILFMGSSTDRENIFKRVSLDEGLCVDLMPYLDADPELSVNSFVQPVLLSMLDGGKLLKLIPCFSVNTIVTSGAFADSLETWDLHTALELNASLPEDYSLFSFSNRDFLLEQLCMLSSIRYVDKASAACSFDTGEFALWLELCKEARLYSPGVDLGSVLKAGPASYMVPQIAQREQGGSYKYIGMPTEAGGVNYFSSAVGGFSILQSSENKNAAWEFLSILLSDELQHSLGLFGYPVIQESLEERLLSDVENEDRVYDREDMEMFLSLVESGRGMAQGSVISDIIAEEAEKYFSGQAELDNTVASIQSRASIYLAEQYG